MEMESSKRRRLRNPFPLKSIPKNYSRYGIPEEILLKKLSNIEEPDLICVSSGMTYWYPGVFKIIEITRNLFKKTSIVLGGIYATLCYEHAKRHSGADIIFNGKGELEALKLDFRSNSISTIRNSQFTLIILALSFFRPLS